MRWIRVWGRFLPSILGFLWSLPGRIDDSKEWVNWMDAWIVTPSDWVFLSLLAAAILSFPAEALWRKHRRTGASDLIPAEQAAEHVARAALDPGEEFTEDSRARAFSEICHQAAYGNIALKGRYNSRFAPVRDIDTATVKFCIPDVNSFALNIPGPDDDLARRRDGTPYGYKRLYVSKARISELWPPAPSEGPGHQSSGTER